MKKLGLIVGLLISANSMAQENLIYCPEKVECQEAGNVNSCRAVGNNDFKFDLMSEWGKIEKSTYIFYMAVSDVDSKSGEDYKFSTCVYSYKSARISKYIHAKQKKVLAYKFSDSNWNINGYNVGCQSSNPKDCPFKAG